MANCSQCGRQLSGLSFGKKLCPWCVQHEAAQRGEDVPVQRVEPAPWKRAQSSSMAVTQAIFGINVAVFLGMAFAGVSIVSPTGPELVHWGANFGPLTIGDGQWWRLLTCVFVHIGITHIALNMWCLWGLGKLAESMYDHGTFVTVYLTTGVFASVASLIWDPTRTSAGASGAIFGIAGALIASLYLGEFSLPKAAVSALLRSVLKFAGYNLVIGFVIGFVDNAAHVGGLLMGLLLGALLAKVAPSRGHVLRRMAVMLVGVLVIAVGVIWLQHSPRAYLLHAQNGYESLQGGKIDKGIAEFRKSVSLRPNFVDGHAGLAEAFARQHHDQEALAEYKRVATLDPGYENVYFNMGVMEARLNLFDDAISSLLKQRQLADDRDNENLLAEMYKAKGMKQDAAAAWQKAAQFPASR
jgi:rhomboid protease GluP